MLKDFGLSLLELRRKQPSLTHMFKVVEGLMPAIPASYYFEPVQNKRKIRATRYKDCESTNIVSSHELKNRKCFINKRGNTAIYKNSFIVKRTSWKIQLLAVLSSSFFLCFPVDFCIIICYTSIYVCVRQGRRDDTILWAKIDNRVYTLISVRKTSCILNLILSNLF